MLFGFFNFPTKKIFFYMLKVATKFANIVVRNDKTAISKYWMSPVLFVIEAYSAAGEIGFSWWLVEHYLPYHVNRPDGCVSGEPARGRKDPPCFQMG